MKSSMVFDDNDIKALREFRERLASKSTIVDFDEQILLLSIRATTRIWEQDGKIVGFAFVDEFNDLWFEAETELDVIDELETEIVRWGITCIKRRNAEAGKEDTLDCTCNAEDSHRLSVLT